MDKAITLSSGGVDSTTLVGMCIEKFGKENVVTVSVSYGQKHSRELECAEKVAEYYGVRHEVLDLSAIFKYSNCSLLQQSTEEVPEGSYEEQINKSESGVVSTCVPFRNGLMLSAVASFGLSMFPNDTVHVCLGAHADDAAGNAYPDCSVTFADAISKAIDAGTDHQVIVETPMVTWNKTQVVRQGLGLKVPYHLTTSCYNGGDCACGNCGTCLDRYRAFKDNEVIDPVPYAIEMDWSGCLTVEAYYKEEGHTANE